jgi:Uncharacterised protein conserved in bacteria (DUF2336)
MVNFSTPPGLEGLFDLDRKGVDIRPTLLRVLTDQYLRTPVHSPDEERHYTELAMRLLDETDIATRAAVSVRLAPHACAPRPIMLQLARDVLAVAEPVLLHSPCLTPADCEAIVRERGNSYAAILARRGKPPAATIEDGERDDSGTQTGDDADARELCELFFAAGSSERRLILLNLDYADWPAGAPPAPLQRADIWRLETAALQHHTATVTRELERALGISDRQARRIVDDEQGEPIVVAAKAMSLPADVLQRMVLFMNPRVGQSVDRVYELSALYREISVEAARRLIAILRAVQPASHKTRDARAIYAAAETAGRALSNLASTAARKPDAPVLRRAVGASDD